VYEAAMPINLAGGKEQS